MLEPIDFELGGESYQLIPHAGFSALNLDRKVTALFGKVVSGYLGTPTEAELYARLTAALGELPDEEFKWLVATTFSAVTVTTPGQKSRSLGSADLVAEHFAGRLKDVNATMLRVWQLEKLSPFGEAAPAGN